MSKPRYDWWSYVKGMIRRYPNLIEEEKALHSPSVTSKITGMPRGGGVSDPTARTAIKELPKVNKMELSAVKNALEETSRLPNGTERIQMVKIVFWDQTHTVAGAAMVLHHSERTVKEWHRDFIRLVAQKYGLL